MTVPRLWREQGARWLAFVDALHEFHRETSEWAVPADHPLRHDADRVLALYDRDELSDEQIAAIPDEFFDDLYGVLPNEVTPKRASAPNREHAPVQPTNEQLVHITTGTATVDEVVALGDSGATIAGITPLQFWIASGVAAWDHVRATAPAHLTVPDIIQRDGHRAFLFTVWVASLRAELESDTGRITTADVPLPLLNQLGIDNPLAPLVEFLAGRPVTRELLAEAHAFGHAPNFIELARLTGRRGLPGIRRALGETLTPYDLEAIEELAGAERYLASLPTQTERARPVTQKQLREARRLGYVTWGERKWAKFADSPNPMVVIQESLGSHPARNLSFAEARDGLYEYALEHFGDDIPPITRDLVDAASAERRTWSYPVWLKFARSIGAETRDAIHAALAWPTKRTAHDLTFDEAVAGLRSFADEHQLPASQRTIRAAARAEATWPETRWTHEGYRTVDAIWQAAGITVDPEPELTLLDALQGLSEFALAHDLPIGQRTIRAARAAGVSWPEDRWKRTVGTTGAIRSLVEAFRAGEPIDLELFATMAAAQTERIDRTHAERSAEPVSRAALPSARD